MGAMDRAIYPLRRAVVASALAFALALTVLVGGPATATDGSGEPPAEPPNPAAAPSGGDDTVDVEGVLYRVSDTEDLLLELDGGGYLPIKPGKGLALDGKSQRFTLRVLPDVASEVAQARAFGQQSKAKGQGRGVASLGASEDPALPALAALAEDEGSLEVVATAALGGAGTEGEPLVASVQSPTTAVHKIWAVPMTPNSGSESSTQSAANIALAVEQLSDYWEAQTNGVVSFELESVSDWTSTSTACNSSNFYTFANQGRAIATDDGYTAGANKHVIMVFPQGHSCGGTAGQAQLGYTLNTGGTGWVTGTTSTFSKFVWNHELGHNLSFGHANRLSCSSGIPSIQNSNCGEIEYGDYYDVMGQSFGTGGSFSAPNAIFSGAWDTDDYYEATPGTHQFTINVVSSNTGKRAIRVEDPNNGDVFYVEARSKTGQDAGAYSSLGEGIRILQRPGGETYYYSSWSGTAVLGQAGNRTKYYFETGESYTSRSGDIVISVVSAGDETAVVEVSVPGWITAGSVAVSGDALYGSTLTATPSGWDTNVEGGIDYTYEWLRNGTPIAGATEETYTLAAADVGGRVKARVTGTAVESPTHSASASSANTATVAALPITSQPVTVTGVAEVGEELTGATGTWEPGVDVDPAQTIDLAYQWLRGSKQISGATEETYTITAQDVGKRLSLRVRGTSDGYATATRTSGKTAEVTNAVIADGASASVDHSPPSEVLTATTDGITTPGVSYKYQWYRGSNKIDGQKSATYTLKKKDRTKDVWVRVRVSKPGYARLTLKSEPTNYGIQRESARPVIVGDLAPGNTISVDDITFLNEGEEVTVDPGDVTYQWYRGSRKVRGDAGTGATYDVTSSDLGKRLSVRVVARPDGWGYYSKKSAKTETIRASAFTGTLGAEVTSDDGDPATLTAAPTGISEDGVTYRFQWLRNGNVIRGATRSSYTLKPRDAGKKVSVRVRASKSGYTRQTVVVEAPASP